MFWMKISPNLTTRKANVQGVKVRTQAQIWDREQNVTYNLKWK
jgi:hypothetical protein